MKRWKFIHRPLYTKCFLILGKTVDHELNGIYKEHGKGTWVDILTGNTLFIEDGTYTFSKTNIKNTWLTINGIHETCWDDDKPCKIQIRVTTQNQNGYSAQIDGTYQIDRPDYHRDFDHSDKYVCPGVGEITYYGTYKEGEGSYKFGRDGFWCIWSAQTQANPVFFAHTSSTKPPIGGWEVYDGNTLWHPFTAPMANKNDVITVDHDFNDHKEVDTTAMSFNGNFPAGKIEADTNTKIFPVTEEVKGMGNVWFVVLDTFSSNMVSVVSGGASGNDWWTGRPKFFFDDVNNQWVFKRNLNDDDTDIYDRNTSDNQNSNVFPIEGWLTHKIIRLEDWTD